MSNGHRKKKPKGVRGGYGGVRGNLGWEIRVAKGEMRGGGGKAWKRKKENT